MDNDLLSFWTHYCRLDVSHADWLATHAILFSVKRGQHLFEPDDDGYRRDYLYFVCGGLLGTLWWDEWGNRRIDRFLAPTDSALTTHNLYTSRPVNYFVIAMRSSTVIRVRADALKAYKEACLEADVLSDVLEHKKLKQYRAKNRLMLIKDEQERYREFVADSYMKPIRLLTSQQEQADYLNISRRTITRAMGGL
ncbi:Crp/Fnr family transcriptional regulator [Parapedobacter sp. 10938]|uniref:Crp/Fnr family transcriptional regulator n=1 Tax=Parapedobacter flavus TaxID=3110225 RepID=UPI002DBB60AA|nr:Crp/Fnr family transcriptional regulator [Parapedobacter sp. 10938]MEC3881906.1 Crp/Fnr family transcriptional regulator [Parapedobacter sp. 10938]